MLCYEWRRVAIVLYQPDEVRVDRRAGALPLARDVFSMTDQTLLWRGQFSNLQTIGNVVSQIVCDYTAGSPNGLAFA